MKHTLMGLAALLLSVVMLFGCATVTETPQATSAPDDSIVTGLVNPVHEMGSYRDLLSAQPGNMLADAPEGASNVVYSYIDGQPVISQITFTYGGNDYTYRAAAAMEAAQTDISGVYEQLTQSAELTAESNTTFGGSYTLRYAKDSNMGLASWYYTPTSCQYTLWTTTGCDVTQQIEEVVDILLPISVDANGNPLTPASNTPIPATEDGKVQGTVVDIQSNIITIELANYNTLQFLLSYIKTTTAKVGDVVEIVYSGNPLNGPEALTITIISVSPAAVTLSGTIIQYTDQSVFVQTANSNVFGFVTNSSTSYTGVSSTLKVGNKVTVSYTGDLSNAPVATIINTTEISADPEPTAEPEPTNKTLKGTVTKLTTKKVSICTDTGHHYTFQRDVYTVMTGNYSMEVGSRICVHYDGYASKGPYAKQIDVLAPPDPTPPDPTPYVPAVYTIYGTITMTAGNALVVLADNGQEYSFLLRSPTISGDLVVGYRITLTYRVEQDGTMNVTDIITTTPIVYEPGPVLMDQPES